MEEKLNLIFDHQIVMIQDMLVANVNSLKNEQEKLIAEKDELKEKVEKLEKVIKRLQIELEIKQDRYLKI